MMCIHFDSTLQICQVSIDNCTTPSYSVVNIVCNDRKGLVYDLMRTMKDIQIRVAYAKIHVRPHGLCEMDVFVQELDGSRILDKYGSLPLYLGSTWLFF